jgi:hypothetical protein
MRGEDICEWPRTEKPDSKTAQDQIKFYIIYIMRNCGWLRRLAGMAREWLLFSALKRLPPRQKPYATRAHKVRHRGMRAIKLLHRGTLLS